MLNYDFKDKVVLVTGGGSGIGEECAKKFAKAGAKVVICDNQEDRVRKVKQEIEGSVVACKLDVTDYNNVVKMINFIKEKFGRIDIIVNSAGICKLMPLDKMDITLVDNLVDINLKGTIYMCKAIEDILKEQKYGKVINMSSIAGRLCDGSSNVYAATKAGIMGFTTAYAREMAEYNVNVNSILPGIVRTNMWEGLLDDFTNKEESIREDTFTNFTNTIPMKRPQSVEDIANMVLFLCSEDAKNVTAQNIAVDGGHTA